MRQIRITPVPKPSVDIDELVGALIDLARQLVADGTSGAQRPVEIGGEGKRSA